MYAYQQAKKEVILALKKHIGKGYTVSPDMLVRPPKPEYGDISFPCFHLAKGLGRNPSEIATELAAKMGSTMYIHRVHAIGPYVNIVFNTDTFAKNVLKDISTCKESYGAGKTGVGRKILIEYANLNTHKDVHIGHIRNFTTGQSTVNILRANGYEVVPVSYINDLGNNVARCIWGLVHIFPDVEPQKDTLRFLDTAYSEAVAAIEGNDERKAEVSQIQRDLENATGPHYALWKKTQKWSIDGLKRVFKEFSLELKKIYTEHTFIEESHGIVKNLLIEGVAKMSDGAVIVDLTEENLGANLLKKSDGTLLYNGKDLALALHKEKDFHADRSLYVIDVRQSLAMKQLIATLKKMNFPREIIHISYDFVTLPEGTMSSRKGNAIYWSDVRQKMLEHFENEIAQRHPEKKQKIRSEIARKLVYATIKFSILKQDNDKPVIFSLEEAMSAEGFTGPYVMYTIARIASMRKKTSFKPAREYTSLSHQLERDIIMRLAQYPELVLQAGLNVKASTLALYACELAQLFSRYYENVRILDPENAEGTKQRLALCVSIAQVLENTLHLLGIETTQEM